MASEAKDKWRVIVGAVCLSALEMAYGQATALVAPPNSRVVEVSPSYLNVIQGLFRLSKPVSGESRFGQLERVCKCTLVGVLQELPHRTTYVFKEGARPNLAVTLWGYEKDGAAIHFGPEALNDMVGDTPASTGLAVARGSRGGVWKITWITGAPGDRQQIELYVNSQEPGDADLEKVRGYAETVHRALR
jgi:hypothetical protein